LAALKSRKPTERLQALDELGRKGEAAREAARAVCEVLASDGSPVIRQAALACLEKIHPELHKSVLVLIVEADLGKHTEAVRKLARLGDDGQAAVPVLLAHLQADLARVTNAGPGGHWTAHPELIGEDLRALAEVAPAEAAVQKVLLEMTRAPGSDRPGIGDLLRPARQTAVQVLADLLQKQPEQARAVVPGLIVSARMGPLEVRAKVADVLGTAAENHAALRPKIAAALLALVKNQELSAIAPLGKCGQDARDALPVLEKLKVHPLEAVRDAANEAIRRIEDASAVGDNPPPKDDRRPVRPGTASTPRRPPVPPADPDLPAELQPIVGRLKAGTAEDRVKAAGELAEMGDKAQPAARALCEAALDTSQKVSRTALQALEKVNAELHQPIFVLVVDDKAANHEQALLKLGNLGEQGAPALPVVLHEIKRSQELLNERRAAWGQPTVVKVIQESMRVLPKIAPENPEALKPIIELTKFTSQLQLIVAPRRGGIRGTNAMFRAEGVQLLGEIADSHPVHRPQIVPVLVGILKETAEETKVPDERRLLEAIADLEATGNALVKCGPEASQALTKDVLPRLKDLAFHKSAGVRAAAEKLRKKIEEGP
jgi:hypothetical protein